MAKESKHEKLMEKEHGKDGKKSMHHSGHHKRGGKHHSGRHHGGKR